jgi:threonine aldolase
VRKVFGGGMRQVGFLAAAGLYALDHHVDRLTEDHKRAKHISEGLEKLPFVSSVMPVDTNIVIFELKGMNADEFIAKAGERNIKVAAFGKQTIRMVTHLDFTDQMLETLIKELKALN